MLAVASQGVGLDGQAVRSREQRPQVRVHRDDVVGVRGPQATLPNIYSCLRVSTRAFQRAELPAMVIRAAACKVLPAAEVAMPSGRSSRRAARSARSGAFAVFDDTMGP